MIDSSTPTRPLTIGDASRNLPHASVLAVPGRLATRLGRLLTTGRDQRELRPPVARQPLASAADEVGRILIGLGTPFTVWRNVSSPGGAIHPNRQLDHIVLGPTGIFAMHSSDSGQRLTLQKGELTGPGMRRGDRPLRTLYRRARMFAKDSGVHFTALVMVVPDNAVAAPVTVARRGRGCPVLVVRRSCLANILRTTIGPLAEANPEDLRTAAALLRRSVQSP